MRKRFNPRSIQASEPLIGEMLDRGVVIKRKELEVNSDGLIKRLLESRLLMWRTLERTVGDPR